MFQRLLHGLIGIASSILVAGQVFVGSPPTHLVPTPTASPIPYVETRSLINSTPSATIDPDPIEPCSGKQQTLSVKRSVCKTLTDCETPKGTWKLLSKSKCSSAQGVDSANEIVDCGPGQNSKQTVKDKASNCKNYVDCGFGDNKTWKLMLSKDCTEAQKASNIVQQPAYQSPNYPNCTIHYAYGGDYTYTGMSPEWCRSTQATADTIKKVTPLPVVTSLPVAPPVDNSVVCGQIRSSWRSFQENFDMNGYSSSAEGMMAMMSQKPYYQSQYSNYGCGSL